MQKDKARADRMLRSKAARARRKTVKSVRNQRLDNLYARARRLRKRGVKINAEVDI